MKKSFTIGRDSQNDIVVMDPSDLVSRLHATLKVDSKGHYKIVDQSTNGTYVNGIRIEKYVDVPVTRKDDITFASVASLDWDEVPKAHTNKSWLIPLISVLGVAIIGLVVFLLINNGVFERQDNNNGSGFEIPPKDSLAVKFLDQDTVQYDATTVKIEVQSNIEWKVEADNESVKIEPATGKNSRVVTLTIPKNTSKQDNTYKITVSPVSNASNVKSVTLSLVQKHKPSNSGGTTNKTPQEKPNSPVI